MQQPVVPVMPRVLENEEDGNLVEHLGPGREGHVVGHAEICRHGMEQPDLRQLDSEMDEEDDLRTIPLLLQCGDLRTLYAVLVEVGDVADGNPGEGASEVDDFVHQEGHDAGREGLVADPGVPCCPE